MGDSLGEEAGDVFVVKIEPGPASGCGEAEAGRQGDWWIAERGEDVPGRGDDEEDGGACQEVEFEQEVELFCDCKVEQDEPDGEDEADQALGEDVQGHDCGEGHAGEERRFLWLFGGERIAFAMGHPVLWCFLNSV